MCNGYFDPKDLENQVNPCSGGNTDDQSPEGGDNGNAGGGCSSDLGANNGGNTCSIYNCTSHKGPVDPQPNWGVGGLSIDNPVNEENN